MEPAVSFLQLKGTRDHIVCTVQTSFNEKNQFFDWNTIFDAAAAEQLSLLR
jgi:hypothetical protein